MSYQVIGTRDRIYPVRTPEDLTAWVDDEIAAMADGWVPLTSELQPDDSMRVIYGKLPAELDDQDPQDPGLHTVPAGRSIRAAVAHALASLVALCVVVMATVAALGLLGTV